MKRKSVALDQPIFVGFTILDLAKLLMFDFYYKTLLPALESNGWSRNVSNSVIQRHVLMFSKKESVSV